MTIGVGYKEKNISVSTQQLRQQALICMEKVEKRLDPKSAFNASSANDSFIGGLLFSFLTWTPMMMGLEQVMEAQHGQMGIFDVVNNPTLCAVFDGVSMLSDEEANRHRSRRANSYYPQGRRQDTIERCKPRRSFNMVAANENCLCHDANTEIAVLAQIIEILDELEKQGVHTLSIDPDAAISTTLKKARKAMKSKGAVHSFGMSVRKAA